MPLTEEQYRVLKRLHEEELAKPSRLVLKTLRSKENAKRLKSLLTEYEQLHITNPQPSTKRT